MRDKFEVRPQALAARAFRAPVDLLPALQAVLDAATRVASYVPIGSEPGVAPQVGWLLPVVLPDGDLDWALYDGKRADGGLVDGGLVDGPRGLREPVGPRLGREAIGSCDLVLVPALLVDRRGHRLGRGGGSYDRALVRTSGLTVALLHDGEWVEHVPTEAHDVSVNAVVTPSTGLVRLSAG